MHIYCKDITESLLKPQGNNKPRGVVQYSREVIPALTSYSEIGKIGVPHSIDTCCGMLKLVSRLHENIGRACDQVMSFQ